MEYTIAQIGTIELDTIILDLNGTLSVKGAIVPGAAERLKALREMGFNIVLFTGDQRGTASELCNSLGITFKKAASSEEKQAFAKELNKGKTVAIGNARIDIGTFAEAAVSIATLQSEGIHTGILSHVDIIVPSITDALDLFIDTQSFCATMRV
jgi:P-type E1-E2 ATPase